MPAQTPMDAIVIRNVVKDFRKSTIRGEHTTFKTELLRWLKGQKQRRKTSNQIQALRGIDLTIPRGKTVGILGRNGSGKSTLLKLITGIYTPTSGTVEVNGRVSALLELGAGFHPDFSGRENILINGVILGMSRAEVRARMDEIIAFSELGEFIDEPVRTYSSGMYMRLAFSVATHVDPDILLVDEILAVGDAHFGKKSLAKMMEFKRTGKTIVLVTHDLSTIERWCDVAAWIDGGKIRRVGTPAEVADEYRAAIALAEQQQVTFTPPALSEDGGALPQVQVAPVVELPKAPPSARASFELSQVRLLDSSGAERQKVESEAPVEVCIDFTSGGPVEGLAFDISLSTADGQLLYETSSRSAEGGLPSQLPCQGRVRFMVERLGLLKGEYALTVSARDDSGLLVAAPGVVRTFSVESRPEEKGVFRPPHRWALEQPVASLADTGRPRATAV